MLSFPKADGRSESGLAVLRFIFIFLKNQRLTVVTVPLSGRGWPIIENVSVVATADSAMIFDARPYEFVIFFCIKNAGQGVEEAGPSGPAVVFLVRREKRRTAAGALVNPFSLVRVQWTRKGTFGAVFSQDTILLRCQPLTPLFFSMNHLFHRVSSLPVSQYDRPILIEKN